MAGSGSMRPARREGIMRLVVKIAAAAGALVLVAGVTHAVLTTLARGSGATADKARATCAACHR
jgi:hypothetical protein